MNESGIKCFVVKFGGSSLADGASISRAVNMVVKEVKRGTHLVVVVSAMGRTTDHLIEIVREACGRSISGKDMDDILAMGERTSARIFSAALRARGLKVRMLDPSDPEWPLITDASFTNASPLIDLCKDRVLRLLKPLLDEGFVLVLPGFVGRSLDGSITTMGRGGSDVTAMVLADCLHADQVILVTDVEGIMTADPKLVKDPKRLNKISVDLLVGLADTGTKFIRKKALKYKSPDIDVKVIKNTAGDLRAEGTIIYGSFPNEILVEASPEPAMAITIVGKSISEAPEIVRDALRIVKNANIKLLGLSMNHNSVIFYLPMVDSADLFNKLHKVILSDEKAVAMAVRKDLALIKVKGVGLEETPGVVNGIANALNSNGINIYGIFTITSSVLVFVDLRDLERAAHLIKKVL